MVICRSALRKYVKGLSGAVWDIWREITGAGHQLVEEVAPTVCQPGPASSVEFLLLLRVHFVPMPSPELVSMAVVVEGTGSSQSPLLTGPGHMS